MLGRRYPTCVRGLCRPYHLMATTPPRLTMFDSSWFLTLKVSSPSIDQEQGRDGLAVSSIPGACLRDALRELLVQKISFSFPKMDSRRPGWAKCMQRAGLDNWFVIDCIPCDLKVDRGLVTRDIRELARKLSSADPIRIR